MPKVSKPGMKPTNPYNVDLANTPTDRTRKKPLS